MTIKLRRKPTADEVVGRGAEGRQGQEARPISLNLRIPRALHAAIKARREQDMVPGSLSRWILDAMEEKLRSEA
jgi:hypothetical protein